MRSVIEGFELAIPDEHPRVHALRAREMIVKAAEQGLLADSALIAHGRGEAFDYLLGEQTCKQAVLAIRHALGVLSEARHPVISVNGNTVALAGKEALILAGMIGASVEVNLFYRTPERIRKLTNHLKEIRTSIIEERNIPRPLRAKVSLDEWTNMVGHIPVLGAEPDGFIPGLEGARAKVCEKGILSADVVFVPLEDGDRCEALVAMDKSVINVDLNPLSRSARMATITIVDDVKRCLSAMIDTMSDGLIIQDWNNSANLTASLSVMTTALERIYADEVK